MTFFRSLILVIKKKRTRCQDMVFIIIINRIVMPYLTKLIEELSLDFKDNKRYTYNEYKYVHFKNA